MRGVTVILTLFSRELKSYFFSPIAYVVAGIFLFINGFFFGVTLQERLLSTDVLFWRIAILLLFVTPVISMRLVSEELRSGTVEPLMTDPVRTWEIITGKYLGSIVFVVILLLPLGGFCMYIHNLGLRIGGLDPGPVLAGFVGLWLMAAAALAIGILFSSMTGNQIVAAVLTFVVLLFLYLVHLAGPVVGGRSLLLRETADYLSLSSHLFRFFRGQIAWQDILFFLKTILLSLFLAGIVFDSRRWR